MSIFTNFLNLLNPQPKPTTRYVPPAEEDPMGDGNLVASRNPEGAQQMSERAALVVKSGAQLTGMQQEAVKSLGDEINTQKTEGKPPVA